MKMRKLKKWIALLLTICTVAMAVAGCSEEAPATEPTQPVTEPAEADQRTWAQRTIETYAELSGVDASVYPESLWTLLEMNPETAGYVLQYPFLYDEKQEIDLSGYDREAGVPLFMQWDVRWGYKTYGSDMAAITACGPLCLSMVAYYFTGDPDMSPDKMMDFAVEEGYCVKGKGTAWTLIGEGAEKLGLSSKELPLSEGVIRRELAKGNPVICVMGPGVFTTTGHFIVLTGYEDGKFRVNDPNSLRRSNKLWSYSEFYDQIRNLWAISAPMPSEGGVNGEGQ